MEAAQGAAPTPAGSRDTILQKSHKSAVVNSNQH